MRRGTKKDKRQKEAVLFIKQKIDSAKWFIDMIKQRQDTLIGTMSAIMKHQQEFFLTGDETTMRPNDPERYCRAQRVLIFQLLAVLLIVNSYKRNLVLTA